MDPDQVSAVEVDFAEIEKKYLSHALRSLREKTKAAMDQGPGGHTVTLTAEEATLVYRLLFDR